jgi:transcriptional regulator with XRE-family HTH domain
MTPRAAAPKAAGRLVRSSRREQGLSQRGLANLAGLSRRTVQRIEQGEIPSADTIMRLESALDLPEGSLAPDWDLPPGPIECDYGARVRARRRALGLSLEELAVAVGVSPATLSRFERGITVPHRWFAEWIDAAGRARVAIVAKPLAAALGFAHVGQLHEFCMAGDVTEWRIDGDRRSSLWLPNDNAERGVAPSNAFPTMSELREAHYAFGRMKKRGQGGT